MLATAWWKGMDFRKSGGGRKSSRAGGLRARLAGRFLLPDDSRQDVLYDLIPTLIAQNGGVIAANSMSRRACGRVAIPTITRRRCAAPISSRIQPALNSIAASERRSAEKSGYAFGTDHRTSPGRD